MNIPEDLNWFELDCPSHYGHLKRVYFESKLSYPELIEKVERRKPSDEKIVFKYRTDNETQYFVQGTSARFIKNDLSSSVIIEASKWEKIREVISILETSLEIKLNPVAIGEESRLDGNLFCYDSSFAHLEKQRESV